MSKLDKYIRLNIKMIGNCTGVACAMSLAIGLTAVNFAVIIFAVVFLGISIAALIKGYKRLYLQLSMKRRRMCIIPSLSTPRRSWQENFSPVRS